MRKTERRRKTKRRCRRQHRHTSKGGMIRNVAKSIFTNTADLGKEIVKDAIKREGFGGEYSNKMKNLNENVKPGIIEKYSSENANPNAMSPIMSPIMSPTTVSVDKENAQNNVENKLFKKSKLQTEERKKLVNKILESNELFTPKKFKM